MLIGFAGAGCDLYLCSNEVLARIPAPDGNREAVVFQRDCGATTGFSTQISIVAKGDAPRGKGTVFVADDDHGRAPSGPGGGPEVRVNWINARALTIAHDLEARIFVAQPQFDDVHIRYEHFSGR